MSGQGIAILAVLGAMLLYAVVTKIMAVKKKKDGVPEEKTEASKTEE